MAVHNAHAESHCDERRPCYTSPHGQAHPSEVSFVLVTENEGPMAMQRHITALADRGIVNWQLVDCGWQQWWLANGGPPSCCRRLKVHPRIGPPPDGACGQRALSRGTALGRATLRFQAKY